MAAYDDRPISVYDNLNMPTSTPKSKAPSLSTATTATSPSTTNIFPATSTPTTNGATNSPYADITFRFNDNNNSPQPLTHLLPSSNSISNQVYPPPLTSNSNTHTYATPFKPTTALTNTPTTTTGSNAMATPTATATTLTNASSAVRPLSQHSQSDLNEATSQSIAAVKAALHDAKSKFFGLNGYASNDNSFNNQTFESPQQQQQHQHQPLLYDQNNIEYPTTTAQRPKVQILTPPPKPQPKYQNIPENSAIFRNQSPPQRPPKPSHYQGNNSNNPQLTSPSSSIQPVESNSARNSPTKMPTTQQPTSSTNDSPIRSLPYATYKQIPLNDIDISSPSQAVYMSTTVPQNIKGSKIAGRHTPTRNSLRHSRMLVVNNKPYPGIQHPNPMEFKQPNLARWLLMLQIIIGSLLATLAIWIFFLAPNTAIQDNPYWSGLVLLVAGILGLILIRYRRIKREKVRENCFLFLRADSYVLSLAAVLLCCVAMIFASIHFARLIASNTVCESSSLLEEHASCICIFNTPVVTEPFPPSHNATAGDANMIWLSNDKELSESAEEAESYMYKVEYRDLSCKEVTCEWTLLLGISMGLNALGLLVSFIYIVLLACHRYDSKRVYTSVQTSTF